MGTLERYLELWDKFEKEIKKHHQLVEKDCDDKIIKEGNLSSFARYVERYKGSEEGNDYNKIYDRLKKMKQRKNEYKSIRTNTFLELEGFYKILKNDYFTQELLEDETPEHWFD